MKRRLEVELVPKTQWYTNVRSNVSKAEWDRIRRKSYAEAGYVCEVCTGSGLEQGFGHPVECHEIWQYNEGGGKRVQKLVGLISLCPKCHKCKHPGLAQMKGEINLVINHLASVNSMDTSEAIEQLEEAFAIWSERSQHDWELDISFLKSY